MPQLILSRGTKYRKNILTRVLPRIELGPYFLLISLVLFVALITVITLMFSARQVTKGYVLNSLESEHQLLVRESEIADMELSQVRSLQFIQGSQKVRRMIRPGRVVFVGTESTIASR